MEVTSKRPPLLALASLVLTTLAIEAVARLAPALFPDSWRELAPLRRGRSRLEDLFLYDAELRFRLAPDLDGLSFEPSGPGTAFAIATRSLGFRGVGFRDDGLSSRPHAVAVGDSFTFCWASQEHCWVEILEQRTGADFVNLGVPGYGGRQELAILERYGLPLSPRLVLWAFYANDLHDNVRPHPVAVDRWTWLERRSVLVAAARRAVRARPAAHPALADPSWPWQLRIGAARLSVYHESDIAKWSSPEALGPGWEAQRDALLRARALTRAAGARLLVIIFPYRELLYSEQYRALARGLSSEDLERPNRLVRELCRAAAIDVLDLGPALLARAGEPFFYERDTHLSPLGNRLAADVILDHLQAAGLLDGSR